MAKRNLQRAGARMEEKKEFDEEVLQIDRVTRVVKGGRRLRFRVTVAIGDRKGRVGIGIGKAAEVVIGIKKAIHQAKKSLIHVSIAEGETIPHPVRVKYKAVELMMLPAAPGTGVIAGGALRKVVSLAGIKNVLSKNFGSRNALVMAQASIKALASLSPARKPAVFKAEASKSDRQIQKEERRKADAKGDRKRTAPQAAQGAETPATPAVEPASPAPESNA